MAATAVAAGTGSPAGTESAEGGPGAAAALELWLNKATDPSMAEQDWSAIQKFCEQVNTDPSGPTHAPWLLAHKIQSPQEKEALYALTVLEICMNHCGEKFHSEVAKFRFLNELIKVLSPKYLGAWATEKVKGRVIEILFSWTVWFPEDIKIRDAYQMLKKQGIIKQDPKLPMDKILPPPSPWPKSIFDADEEKSKLLTRLLKSNHPEDLQAANRLIKNLVKEEQEKSEKVSRRVSAVEEVRSHVRVLREMLSMYRRPGHALPDQQALQVVYERCEKLRPTLFRLASDTTDDDDALAEILQANDLLTQGVRLYKQVVEGRVSAGNAVPAAVGAIPAPRAFPNPEPCGLNCPLIDLETPSLLHQDLAALGINDVPTRNQVVIPSCCNDKKQPGAITLMGGGIQSLSADRNLLDLFSPQPSPGLNYVPQKKHPQGGATRYQGLSRLVLGGWAIGFFHSLTEYTSGSCVCPFGVCETQQLAAHCRV